MNAQTSSLRRVIVLSLLLTVASMVLMAGALFSYQLYRSAGHAGSMRLRSVAAVVSGVVADAASLPPERQDAVWAALTAREPSLRGVQLRDFSGAVVLTRGDEKLFEGVAPNTLANQSEYAELKGSRGASPAPAGVSIGLMPMREPVGSFRGGTCFVAMTRISPSQADLREAFQCLMALVGMGIAGVVMGAAVLRRYVLLPLRALSEKVRLAAQSGESPDLPVDRGDEIGLLAVAMQELQGRAREWRTRATRLEYTIDRRVNAETRRIHSQLRNVERKAWTDPLTGLGNRRLFDEKIDDIFAAQQRAGRDLAVVMIDVDHFKQLNDTLGHAAGDEILHFIGELLQQCLREHDLAIRLGGDEFLLILPGSSAADAAAVSQRLIRLFAQRAQLINSTPRPSMSAGVASMWQTRSETAAALVRYGDEALYAAKRSGKGRVYVHEPVEESPMTL